MNGRWIVKEVVRKGRVVIIKGLGLWNGMVLDVVRGEKGSVSE